MLTYPHCAASMMSRAQHPKESLDLVTVTCQSTVKRTATHQGQSILTTMEDPVSNKLSLETRLQNFIPVEKEKLLVSKYFLLIPKINALIYGRVRVFSHTNSLMSCFDSFSYKFI